MEQTERIFKLAEEFKDNLKKMYGEYTLDEEVKDGKKLVILTTSKGERHVLGFLINQEGFNLISVPEGEDINLGPTELEKHLLDVTAKRVIHTIIQKFTDKTGWELLDLGMVFYKGSGRILCTFNPDDGFSITEGEIDFGDDDEE